MIIRILSSSVNLIGCMEATLPLDVLQLVTGANYTLVLLEYDSGRREFLGCGDRRKGLWVSAQNMMSTPAVISFDHLTIEGRSAGRVRQVVNME